MREEKYYKLGLGLDLVTPGIEKNPGSAIGGANYEPRREGYRRLRGFERYDGRPRPSEATYAVLNFDAGVAAISEDDIVTGATSGATGIAVVDAVVQSGSYGTSDAAGYLVLYNISGTFQDNENLQVSAATKSVANGTVAVGGADNDTDDGTWLQAAIEKRRTAIQAIPGSGSILGAWRYNNKTYGFRNNAGGTAAVMHVETASGWSAIDLGSYLAFDAGTAEFEDGETLTGGSSGATATIARVAHRTGTFSGGDAVGILVLTGVSGAFQDNETITGGTSSGSATSDGTLTTITLPAGGRYEFENENFYGHSGGLRMYGVNGVGFGFEFDGTVFVPIFTGMTTDTPTHLAVHKGHLSFSFPGGSWQHSSTGTPYGWNPVTGAAEIGMGDEVIGLVSGYVGVLILYCRDRTGVLYGNDVTDWSLDILSKEAGGIEWSVQNMGTPLIFDEQGIRSLRAVQNFGSFQSGTMTELIRPLIDLKRDNGVSVTASCVVRASNQYRLFFDDGTGILMDLSTGNPRFMPLDYGMTIRCVSSTDNPGENERIFFGSDDGYIYEADVGNSFDDDELSARLRLAFYHCGTPRLMKRYMESFFEIDAGPTTTITFTAEFSYASSETIAMEDATFSVTGGGGFWGEFVWDDFYWDNPVQGEAKAHLAGEGTNISFSLATDARYEDRHVISGNTLHYSKRRQLR